MAVDWSMLPSDPLGAIAMKLDVLDDFIHFSAVCQGWYRASSLVKHQWKAPLPLLLLVENTKENPDCLRKIFNLNSNQFDRLKLPETFGTRCWGSAYGWVAMADMNRSVQLFNPITKAHIHFPSLKTLEHYPDPKYEHYLDEDHRLFRVFLIKLVVLRVSRNNHHEFVIMVLYNVPRYLAFARHGDETWTSVSTKEFKMDYSRRLVTAVIDVVARNDDIFVLYDDGAIVHWNAREFYSNEILNPVDYSPPCTLDIVSRFVTGLETKYLVEFRGDLIMVIRYKELIYDSSGNWDHEIAYRTNAFDVFKLTRDNRWEKIEDLSNVALVLGSNYSMSISLGVAQCLQHSRIYFTDDEFDYWIHVTEFGGHDTGFYDIKQDKIQFYKDEDMRSLFCPSTWFIPNQ